MEKQKCYEDIFVEIFPNASYKSAKVTHNWQFTRSVKRLMGATSCLFLEVSGVKEAELPQEFVTEIFGNCAEVSIDKYRFEIGKSEKKN